MSVVNKMLQDLDTRKKANRVEADYIPMQSSTKNWVLIFAVLSVAVIAFAVVLLKGTQSPPTNIYAQQLPVTTSHTSDNSHAEEKNSANIDLNEGLNANHLNTNHLNANQNAELNTKVNAGQNEEQMLAEDAASSNNITSQSVNKKPLDATATANLATEQRNQSIDKSVVNATSAFNVAPSNGANASVSAIRERARIALEQNDVSAAIGILEELVLRHPEDTKARKQLASLLFSHNAIERAYTTLKEGLVITPADSPIRIMLARVAFKKGDFEDAHTVLSEHPYPTLADIKLISFRAALSERLSRYQIAYQDYQVLVRREPKNARWWLGLGVSQDKLELQQEALDSYQQAMLLKQLPEQVNTFVEQRIVALEGQS